MINEFKKTCNQIFCFDRCKKNRRYLSDAFPFGKKSKKIIKLHAKAVMRRNLQRLIAEAMKEAK
jgi:hypothetical protein